jgi:TPR repeat protein
MYHNSKGVPQDYAQAVTWFRKAADQGDADAQFFLGLMYAKSEGVPQDYVLAHMWLNLASSRYSESEKERREKAEKNRDIAATKMTPAQVAKAQKLAREWKPKKAK